jgi:transcriptional regulator with XRE-family HTH domain
MFPVSTSRGWRQPALGRVTKPGKAPTPVGNFADALRDLLNERKVSQRELARRLAISAQAVNGWLNAGVTPTRENVERVEDELAVEPRGWLLELAGYSPGGPQNPTSPEVAIRADPGLHPEDKRALLHVLRIARERYTQAEQSLP